MICILGGCGFIGTRLAARLQEGSGQAFSLIDNNRTLLSEHDTFADVRSSEDLERAIPNGSTLINLAAAHKDNVKPESLYFDVNVEGARNVCGAARKKNVSTIVFTSSVAVYGSGAAVADEKSSIAPDTPYGESKAQAERIYMDWQQEDAGHRKLVVVRPTVVFGEKNRGNVYNLMRQIAMNKFVMIGDGCNKKSMAYVGNLVEFLVFAFGLPPGIHVHNYVDKPDFEMDELVKEISLALNRDGKIGVRLPYAAGYSAGIIFDILSGLMGKELPIGSKRVRKFCSSSVYNTNVSNLGFVPEFDIISALRKTVGYEFSA